MFQLPLELETIRELARGMAERAVCDTVVHWTGQEQCPHYGTTGAFPLEHKVPGARGFAWGGGTTEILRNTIASMVYGRRFDQRRG